jgi:hypothetical protein
MAKKSKSITDAAAESQSLTPIERSCAERVLISQGRAIGMLDCFPVATQRALAAFCDPNSFALKAGTLEGAARLIADFYAEQKATDEQEGTGFGLPDAAK